MAYMRERTTFRKLSVKELEAWKHIPPAVASDCMNRTQAMTADIKPVQSGLTLCGQARTVTSMAGDCGSIGELIDIAEAGEIIIADAGGIKDTAVWGGIMTAEAKRRNLGGAVIAGAVRDLADIRRTGFNMFVSSVVQRGPHYGFGGTIDCAISAAGVPVMPSDIVLGDEDGMVIVPLWIANQVLLLAQEHLKKEEYWLSEMAKGVPMRSPFVMPTSAIQSSEEH